ncbi:MAG TPA: DNA polymerase I [Dehalococcoidia bacterium]|nr:DNA polymerase I [Dehalococcoidia bacterium]
MNQRLVLFDGNALVHRAYHAMKDSRPLTTRSGEVVSGVYVFTLMLLKVLDDLKPTHYAIAFDTPVPTFRHEMFAEYKAHRPPTPDELIQQMDRVRQLVDAFHMPVYELDGYEADDVLGSLSRQASEQSVETIIVTGDADTMQLVTDQVKVLYPRPRGTFSDVDLYDEAAVSERYGVRPEHIPDYKALLGDPSDNIPGVPGIGKKTAAKLIQQFGGIEDIYAHIDEVTPPKTQDILRENEATARKSLELATIVTGTPVTLDLDECLTSHYDRNRVTNLFRELEFNSLMNKLPEGDEATTATAIRVGAGPPPKQDYHTITDSRGLDTLLNRLTESRTFTFDLETTGLNAISDQPVGISVSPSPGEAYYVPVGHVGWGLVEQLPLEQVLDRLRPLFEDTSMPKIAHNGKFDMTILAESGVTVNNLAADTMIAAYLLSEKSLGLKALAFQRLGVEMTPITDLIGKGARQISMSQVPIEQAAEYACADADITGRLNDILQPELHREGLWQLFTDVEMPLVPVLVHMERSGISLDTKLLNQMSLRLGEQLRELEKEIYNSVGHQFNINSPRQLGSVLFEELQLPGTRKKGSYSTAAPVLEALREVHPVAGYILDYRQLSKLKSTYIDSLPELVNSKTGRVHTSFNQTRTATGRLSSSDPNLQNIPIRGEQGKQIRQAFIAPSGSRLFGADYSQIDLRVLAHLSQDKNLLDAFQHDEDIHAATASQLFGVTTSEVTADMRRLAKTVNFGVIYGMSEYGLEQATEFSREEAAKFIDAYFEKYPGVKQYLESTKQKARETGCVQTLLGRKRTIAEINSSNRQVREAAERMAINMPVQGTSADIIKVAMINLYREMNQRHLKSKMLLQVHDELVFEVPQEETTDMNELVPHLMSTALELSIPLKVDTKTGNNWGEME